MTYNELCKKDLLSFSNKGKFKINGITLEVIVRPSSVDGTPWLEIYVEPLSPLHPPLILGQKWVEYITDDECAELPGALLNYKKEAETFYQLAQRIVTATMNSDGTYKFIEVPESVQADFKDYPSTLSRWLKQKHTISYVNDSSKEWFAPGCFTLDLDGVLYVPRWSYWLDRPYYECKIMDSTK